MEGFQYSASSTCLLTAPFSSQSADHLVLMVVLHASLESNSPPLERFCKLSVPPLITTSTGTARVVFEGRVNSNCPAGRRGTDVLYNNTD